KRLRTILERREGKSVELTSEVDPALLGGLQVRLGNRVIDASIRRQLINLRERLEAVRVH
ncbi:MAG: F0F1 ATP synthase subunit delta, partial [Candidatus Omnitrophica bacterium]|nr:F0F1 ATP synthase subunit delta [Candidatus Omnitrophota bacterium]